MITIRVPAQQRQRLGRLASRLRQAAGGGLQQELVDGLRREAPAALDAVRAAWMGVEVTSSRGGGTASTGLRARVAAATEWEATGRGVHFEVDAIAVDPAYGRTLTWGLYGYGRWRHPVFGNREAWTQQRGEEVFFKTLFGREPQWREELEQACERVARQIEG